MPHDLTARASRGEFAGEGGWSGDADVAAILRYPPFCHIERARFPNGEASIRQLIVEHSRLRHFAAGDVIARRGEYMNTAYLILRGAAVAMVRDVVDAAAGESTSRLRNSIWYRLAASMRGGLERRATVRSGGSRRSAALHLRRNAEYPQLYVKDIAAVFADGRSTRLGPGNLIGEVAVMARSPCDYTAAAAEPLTALEIRWQGLRQLRRDKAFAAAMDRQYRDSTLRSWLTAHPILRYCPPEAVDRLAAEAELLSFGDREWFSQYQASKSTGAATDDAIEPVIASEGEHADHLLLIRSGFARQCHRYGSGQRTTAYLAQGQVFGWEEICHNAGLPAVDWLPYQHTLRGLGYLDVIRVAKPLVEELVLPFCRAADRPQRISRPRISPFGETTPASDRQPGAEELPAEWLDALVDDRLVNARSALVIDIDRCTRCDDCVRACAAGHAGLPRFTRAGVSVGHYQVAQSCMHCVDPVCMVGCPTAAIRREPNTGIVVIEETACIGCGVCAAACPYDNIVMEMLDEPRSADGPKVELPQIQVASKCDLCVGLRTGPACVAACPHDALARVDLSDTARLRSFLGLEE